MGGKLFFFNGQKGLEKGEMETEYYNSTAQPDSYTSITAGQRLPRLSSLSVLVITKVIGFRN